MRSLATLSWLTVLASALTAQEPKKSAFATDPAKKTATSIDVTVLPATPIVPPPPIVPAKSYCPEQLLRMSECELIEVYKCGIVSPVPCGYTPGTVIYKPGSKIVVPASKLFKATAWQGKYITCDKMINRQFGLPSITADIMSGESWIDGGPTLVFDYWDSSFICKQYRDEVREVSPGVYLGCMHRRDKDGPRIATWFALDTRCTKAGCLKGKK
jgi:hypothetical protein